MKNLSYNRLGKVLLNNNFTIQRNDLLKEGKINEQPKIDNENFELVSFDINKLSIEEFMELAKAGKMTRDIAEKWLRANAEEFSCVEKNGQIEYSFAYKSEKYSVTIKEEKPEIPQNNKLLDELSIISQINIDNSKKTKDQRPANGKLNVQQNVQGVFSDEQKALLLEVAKELDNNVTKFDSAVAYFTNIAEGQNLELKVDLENGRITATDKGKDDIQYYFDKNSKQFVYLSHYDLQDIVLGRDNNTYDIQGKETISVYDMHKAVEIELGFKEQYSDEVKTNVDNAGFLYTKIEIEARRNGLTIIHDEAEEAKGRIFAQDGEGNRFYLTPNGTFTEISENTMFKMVFNLLNIDILGEKFTTEDTGRIYDRYYTKPSQQAQTMAVSHSPRRARAKNTPNNNELISLGNNLYRDNNGHVYIYAKNANNETMYLDLTEHPSYIAPIILGHDIVINKGKNNEEIWTPAEIDSNTFSIQSYIEILKCDILLNGGNEQGAFENFGCEDDASKEKRLLNCIDRIMEKEYPNRNGYFDSSVLQSILESDTLKKIFESDEEYFKYMGCDGEFGDITATSGTSFVSGIMTLLQTTEGQEALAKAIKWSDDHSTVTVTIGNQTIELTAAKIMDAMANPDLVKGDGDWLILQLALKSEEAGGYISNPSEVWARLLGVENQEITNVSSWLEQINSYVATSSSFAAAFEMKGKAYGVKYIENGVVYCYNPNDTSEILTMNMEDLGNAKLYLSCLVISEPNPVDEGNSDYEGNVVDEKTPEEIAQEILSDWGSFKENNKTIAEYFESAFNNLGCYDNAKKQKAIESIIKLYNMHYGPIQSMNNLSSADLTILNTIKDSVALDYMYNCDYMVTGTNSTVGTNAQNRMEAAISIILLMPEIYKNVFDSIKWDSDYKNIEYVKVPGGEYDTFNNNADKFEIKSRVDGDKDANLLTNIIFNISSYSSDGLDYYEKFFGDTADINYITKKKISDKYTTKYVETADIDALLNQALYAKQNGKNFAANFVLYKIQYLNTIDGYFGKTTEGNMSYSITDITENTVTFTDLCQNVSYKMSWTEFRKLRMYSISTVSFNNVTEPVTLLDKEDGVDAEFIINNLAMLRNSEESGVKEFIQILDSAFEKFECFYDSDKRDLVNYIIRLYNNKYDKQNPNTNMLSQNTLNNMDSTFISRIESIINSKELKAAYYCDEIIEDSFQSNTGNCWALSAIQALAATPAGEKLLKDAITWNDDGSFSVYFAGIDYTVTLSADEVLEYTGKNGTELVRSGYNSDITMLLLQHALEDLYMSDKIPNRENIGGDRTSALWYLLLPPENNYNYRTMTTVPNKKSGNYKSSQSVYKYTKFFTKNKEGNNSYETTHVGYMKIEDLIKNIYTKWKNNEFACATMNLSKCSWTNVDGTKTSCTFTSHAFAITNIICRKVTVIENGQEVEKETYLITFTNPWYPDQPYTVTMDEFLSGNIKIKSIDYII